MSTGNDDKIIHASGAASSYCPDLTQIPYEGLEAIAKRFEFGAAKYGRGNWKNGIPDKTYCIERLNHIVRHAYSLAQKLEGTKPWDDDDDAGAIAWGGVFAVIAQQTHRPADAPPFLTAQDLKKK